jgi:hypothetical protein
MTRSPCLNHPEKDVIEIPKGYKYCERCHHLVAPELEIVEIIEETPVEAELEIVTADLADAIIEKTLDETMESPIILEPEVKEPLEESPEETAPAEAVEPIEEEAVVETPVEEAKVDNTAEIEALRARLAELE